MATAWLFMDEFGDTKFGAGNSTYFGLASILTVDPAKVVAELDAQRHYWWSAGHVHGGWFHAKDDCFPVRNAVFDAFSRVPIDRCDILGLTKENVDDRDRSAANLYRLASKLLLRSVMDSLSPEVEALMLVAASWSPAVKDLRPILSEAFYDAGNAHQSVRFLGVQAASGVHAGLQFADYLGWAGNRLVTRRESNWLDRTKAPNRGFQNVIAV